MTPLRLGLIGGGPGSLIGPVHRMAAELDGRIRLVAGAFSSDPDASRAAAEAYGLEAAKGYRDVEAMLVNEPLDVVAIATPNHLHAAQARAVLAAGVDVMSDKPATATLAEALILRDDVRASGRRYGLTHSYTGYAMVREARALVADGAIGRVRKVVVEYSQGWLSERVEDGGSRQASWRADPARSGAGGCIADIGVHAFNVAEYVSGEAVTELCADLSRMVPGRRLDDDANLLLRFAGGAPGVLHASQVACGDRNGLSLRVWGESGGLHWHHEAPDRLMWESGDQPARTLHAGSPYLSATGRAAGRLPPGHMEGFIEAFANLYRAFGDAVRGDEGIIDSLLPGIEAGVRGMAFIETAIASSAERSWRTLDVPA